MILEIARKPVVITVSFCAILLFASALFISSGKPPVDRKVSNVALSSSGRWLAAGSAQGNITIWDQVRPAVPKQFAFPHGSLNDLGFSPMKMCLSSLLKLSLYMLLRHLTLPGSSVLITAIMEAPD